MTSARALVFAGVGRIELADIILPELAAEEALVETDITAVSQGTDRAMLTGSYGGIAERYPLIYGYSRVGTVVRVGSAVTGVSLGDRVFAGMAGTRLDPADGYGEMGGSYTSHGVIHQSDLVRLPDSVDSATAALAVLGAIAYQGVVKSKLKPRSRVLVVGLGAVGQFSALFSAMAGAQVWGLDLMASRRELAARFSGAVPLDPDEDLAAQVQMTAWGERPWPGRNGRPRSDHEQLRWEQATGVFDAVIDASGRSDAFQAYVPLLVREGCLCLQGYYASPLTLDFHPAHMKRITVCCPGGMDLVDYETVLRVVSDRVDVSSLVGTEFSIEEAPAALDRLLLQGDSPAVCALIRWKRA